MMRWIGRTGCGNAPMSFAVSFGPEDIFAPTIKQFSSKMATRFTSNSQQHTRHPAGWKWGRRMFIAIVVGYLVGATLTYGLIFAYYQRKYPTIATETRGEDIVYSVGYAVIWPLGLPIHLSMATFMGGGSPFRYGLKYRLRETPHA